MNGETGVGQVISNRIKHGDKVNVYQGAKSTGSLKFDLEIREADKVSLFYINCINFFSFILT